MSRKMARPTPFMSTPSCCQKRRSSTATKPLLTVGGTSFRSTTDPALEGQVGDARAIDRENARGLRRAVCAQRRNVRTLRGQRSAGHGDDADGQRCSAERVFHSVVVEQKCTAIHDHGLPGDKVALDKIKQSTRDILAVFPQV